MKTNQNIKINPKAWIFPGLLVLCLIAGAALPALAQDDDTSRLQRLENEVQTLSRAVFKGEQPPPGSVDTGGGSAGGADMSNRMDQLETQLRQMNGQLEDQTHQIDVLKDQLQKMSGDVDTRFNDMQHGASNGGSYVAPGASAPNAAPSNIPASAPPMPSSASHYISLPGQNSQLQAQDSAQPPTDNDVAPPQQGAYSWSSKTAGQNGVNGTLGTLTTPANGATAAPPAAGADPASTAYESAFSLLKSGQYDSAEKGFSDFLAQYPGNSLTGNAKYWLGETYYARGQYDKASRTFAEAYQDAPKGPKAPDNLLKLGMSLAGMGKKDDACVALGQIEKEYSATAGPVLRRAQEEKTKVGC